MFEIMNECGRIDLENIIEWLSGLTCKYLIVKHDKDTPRLPHYHIFVKLDSNRTIKDIAKQCKIESQYVQRVKSWKNALAYAFHLTDNAKNDGKYQYDENAIVKYRDIDIKAIFKLSKEYDDKREHYKALEKLLTQYGDCEITKTNLLRQLTAEDYNKYSLMFKRMQEYRIMKVRDRDMKVIYITGGSGTGKTTLAKYFATIQNYDYFVSGSGKDLLDGYDKEECIILDDFRGDIFTKAELFKLTDNNTNSSVKSRFKNKDISYCKLMIITSVKTPHDLYDWRTIEDKDETFKQFSRRLNNLYLLLTEEGDILECHYDIYTNAITKKLVTYINMNEVFAVLNITKKVGSDLMTQIYQAIKDDIDKKKETLEEPEQLPF